ncbi:MAG: GAF domain-containing protein [Clostridiales bacterium]|nr:GAF domain-containing protein [Clostridiales bacterium]
MKYEPADFTAENVDAAAKDILQRTGEAMGVNRLVLFINVESQRVLEYRSMWCEYASQNFFMLADRIPFTAGAPLYEAFMSNSCAPYPVNSTTASPEYLSFSELGITAFLTVPVFVEGDLWGVLSFERCKAPYVWGAGDIQMAALAAALLASAVSERANLRRELAAAREAAFKAGNAKIEFLSRMSHEMRTPLNAITGMTGIAKNTTDGEKIKQCLGCIEDASAHLMAIIDDIFDMSRIEMNEFNLAMREFDLPKMFAYLTRTIKVRTDEKKQVFRVNIQPDLPFRVVCDEERLSQVIMNMLTNAVKFTDEGGTISLSAEKISEKLTGEGLENVIQIIVSDNGVGMSLENQEKIFSAFEQGDGGIARKYGGAGLGLAISRRIVELMGGEIRIVSELGKGSSFYFTIKVIAAHTAASERAKGTKADTARETALSRPLEPDQETAAEKKLKTSDYSRYIPFIDVKKGLDRLMNNKRLYAALLKTFSGRQMADELITGIKAGSFIKINQTVTALKGVSANLGLDELYSLAEKLETQFKERVDATPQISVINEVVDKTVEAVKSLLEDEGGL